MTSSADAGDVVSRLQLERLLAEGELAGRNVVGFIAGSVGMASADLDNVSWQRVDLREADGDDARLERAQLLQCDARQSRWRGALWNRVQVRDSDTVAEPA